MFRDPQGKELGLAVIGGLIGGGWGAINGYISGDRGWQLAADIGAGAGTGALAGLTNGASLIELAATRAVVSAGIESTRQIANGLMSPCHEVNIHGWGIAFAGDVPPLLSSDSIWSPIPQPKEIGREEAFYRRADHRLPARG